MRSATSTAPPAPKKKKKQKHKHRGNQTVAEDLFSLSTDGLSLARVISLSDELHFLSLIKTIGNS